MQIIPMKERFGLGAFVDAGSSQCPLEAQSLEFCYMSNACKA